MPNPIVTTQTTSNVATTIKDFYDRKLLEHAQTQFVFANFAQKKPLPKNSGKKIEWRRYNLFDPNVQSTKLAEGVTPDSRSITQSTVSATVEQYGAYVEYSDLLDLTAIDPVASDSVEILGELMGTVLDHVTRNAMVAGASAQYAGTNSAMTTITSADKLTVADIRKAVRSLKKAKARRFTGNGANGHFVMVLDPDVSYDIQNDSMWQDVSKYQNAEQLYSGELGRLFGVVFVESTEGYVSKQSVLNAVDANTSNSATFVLKNDLTEEEKEFFHTPGKKFYVGSNELTLASTDPLVEATKTVTLSAATSLSANAIVYSTDCGACDASTKAGIDVHHSLIFGADSYGVVDISGSGNVRTIIKPIGTCGYDPLDQRGTIGAKVTAFAAKVLNNLWIIDVMSAAS